MSYGNLHFRPDLGRLFGQLGRDEHEFLLDQLLKIDGRLKTLAEEAGRHVGLPYRHTGLGLFIREDDAEIAGGPFGDAGDIWFEIGHSFDERSRRRRAPPWTVDSRIIVFCADLDPVMRGSSCTHDLVCLVAEADTPSATVQTLSAHVDALTAEVLMRSPADFTQSTRAALEVGRHDGYSAGANGRSPFSL